jgi:predicted HTH transcriptional regulator
VRLIFYKGKNKLETREEVVGKKGYAVGFEGLVKYIRARLPQREVIESGLRKDEKVYPETAIRELIANALIHQDLTQKGSSPMVEIYSDRIEITNSGKPLIDPKRFIDEVPKSRNEALAGLMKKAGICEERGSGIDKVIHAAETFRLPAPDFIEKTEHMVAVLYAPRALEDMAQDERIRACYQHACLKQVSGEQMTNSTLRARLNIPKESHFVASKIISDTLEAGLIKDYDPSNKSKRYASYIPFWAPQASG